MVKRDLMEQIQEVYALSGSNAVRTFLESHDIELDNLEGIHISKPYIKDNSKVKWKTGTQFIKMFSVELIKLVNKKGVLNDIELLGLATRLSLQVDFEDNSLINKDGSYITQKDIMDITGWGKKKVAQSLKQLIDNEIIYIDKQEEDQRKNRYYMNPNIFYKGSNIDKEVKQRYDK